MKAPSGAPDPARKWAVCGWALLVFAITLAVYWPVKQHGFIPLDDHEYVVENPHVMNGLTADGIAWAFTHFHSANWHPLTWLSHMLDCQLWGLDAGASHIGNVALHAASAALLFVLLHWMTSALWRSLLVAALFAWHPLHVQSVAWIAERKDVLSALFWMLTLLAYVRCVRAPSLARRAAVVVLFALGLLAKPMVVTLPFVLLLLDYWPLARVRTADAKSAFGHFSQLVLEKWPLFLLSAVSCVITLRAQHAGGAIVPVDNLPLSMRVENSAVSYAGYLWQTIWPVDLAILYPYSPEIDTWRIAVAVVLLASISIVAFKKRAAWPYFAVGWAWYLGTLVPVIGIVQVGGQPMADRYTYLPLIGVFVAGVWGAAELLSRKPSGRIVGAVIGTSIGALLLFGTVRELRNWRTTETLFRRSLAAGGETYLAHTSLGFALMDQGKNVEAVAEYESALRLAPRNAGIHAGLANALAALERYDEGIAHFEKAVEIAPGNASAQHNLGSLYFRQKRVDEAMARYAEAVRLEPDRAEFQFSLGACCQMKGQVDEAVAHFERAIRSQPDHAEALNNLASIQIGRGKYKEAVANLTVALRVKPDSVNAHVNMASALMGLSSTREALEQYRAALHLNSKFVPALIEVTWIFASGPSTEFLNGVEAVRAGERAVALSEQRSAGALDALGAAYAESGRFEDAVNAASKAREIAMTNKQTQLAAAIDARLQLYRASKPYRRSK